MKRRLAMLAAGMALLAAACGSSKGSGPSVATRTVDVDMQTLAFAPNAYEAKVGETVAFRFKNTSRVVHEAVFGDQAFQDQHEMDMTSGNAAGAGMHHGDTTEVVTLEAGKTGTVSHTFDKAGTFLIACHQPGHYAGGMKATVVVT